MYIRQIQRENVVDTTKVENIDEFLEKLNRKGRLYELVKGEPPKDKNNVNIVFEDQEKEEQ